MKKFTLSYNKENGSNKSIHSIHAASDRGHEPQDLPRISKIQILLTELEKQSTLEVIGDALISQIKSKLLEKFGGLFEDGLNMGLYLPGDVNKMGKFLEEDRLLSEYTGYKLKLQLLFISKQRLRPQRHTPVFDKPIKEVQKSFLRYVSRGDHKKASATLDKGLDPNFHCSKTGETPLTKAVMRSKPHTMIGVLIAGGAFCAYYSKSGLSPLHKAAIEGNYEAVKSLLDFGQSPNTRCRDGLTPLYHNILHDQNTKICHSLLYEHSELGVHNEDGLQELHQAARLNRAEQINLLIMYGADVNSRCRQVKPHRMTGFKFAVYPDDTPLHVAAAAGQREAIVRLLSWGADPKLTNSVNRSPIEVAQCYGHSDLAELMRLFRGTDQLEGMGGPFLPTPTYNPKRRMKRPPSNSYVTEPTNLVDYFFENRNEDPLVQTAMSRQPVLKYPSSVQRTISMVNLQPITNKSIQYQTDVLQSPMKSPDNSPCFLSTQAYYDSLKESAPIVGQTLGRRPKQLRNLSRPPELPSQCHLPYRSTKPPNSTKFTSELKFNCPEYDLDRSRFEQPIDDRITSNFQREGSQTDSGISNSSNDRPQSTSDSMENSDRSVPHKQMEECLDRTRDSPRKIQTTYPLRPNTLKHSLSVHDGRTWRLNRTPNLKAPEQQINVPVYGQSQTPHGLITPPLLFDLSKRVPRTVSLTKSDEQSDQLYRAAFPISMFGLSLRTSKDPFVVAHFRPSLDRPSLQTATRVIPNMPAYNAGIREGDFILKINNIDVTRSSHDDVSKYLCGNDLNTVQLTVVSPLRHPAAPKPPTAVLPLNQVDLLNESSTSSSSSTFYSFSMEQSRDKGVQNYPNIPTFTRAVRQPAEEGSGLSSARSSDRTNCSSLPDEGIWSPPNGMSSADASARSSFATHVNPLNESEINPMVRRPHSGSTVPECNREPTGQLRIVRSRTTSGISEFQNSTLNQLPLAQSLYFARNPRFHRLGSQDSHSSMSSCGGVSPAQQVRNKQSNQSISAVQRKPAQSRVARLHKTTNKTVNPSTTNIDQVNLNAVKPRGRMTPDSMLRYKPAHPRRTPSLGYLESSQNYADQVIQPPAEFR